VIDNVKVQNKFQSSPAIAGGRYDTHPGDTHPGDTVSILTRHRWRALPPDGLTAVMASLFQSSPAIAGGRYAIIYGLLRG